MFVGAGAVVVVGQVDGVAVGRVDGGVEAAATVVVAVGGEDVAEAAHVSRLL